MQTNVSDYDGMSITENKHDNNKGPESVEIDDSDGDYFQEMVCRQNTTAMMSTLPLEKMWW